MGTKNDPGADDCHANADPDEPMFVLLGRVADVVLFAAAATDELDVDQARDVYARLGTYFLDAANETKR